VTFRTVLSSVALLFVGLLLAWQVARLLANPTIWPPDDFVEYWAAGRLALNGEDPYSPPKLLELERLAGRDTDEAIMMWNPPWTLPVVMPLGAMPARAAQLVWLGLGLAALGFSTDRLWRDFDGPAKYRWVAWAIALAFIPAYMVLQSGQIGPLLVLGAVGFIAFDRLKLPYLAGAATVLLAIKPHLAYLLWLALVADVAFNRRWKHSAGALGMGLLFAVVPLAFNPDVYQQYAAALRDHPPAQWVSLTMGTVLRMIFGQKHFWLQFVPVLLGIGWFAWHWYRRAKTWDWVEQTPLLVLVSFVTSPYGAWHFDLVLLLVPLLHLAATLAKRPMGPITWMAVGLYVASNAAMLVLNAMEVWSFAFAWFAPLALGCYAFAIRPRRAA